MQNKIIELKGIKRYFNLGDETIYAIKEIDLDIFKNEYVALMGQSV